MPRPSIPSSSKANRLKALPWAAALQGAVAVNRHWRRLSEKERARARQLLKDSGGRIGSLSAKERAELRKLVGKLDLKGIGRELLPIARGKGKGRRGRSK
jgi:hypothetical protein